MVERMFYQRYNTEKYSFNPYDSYYSTLEMTFIIICYGYGTGEFLILLKYLKNNENYINECKHNNKNDGNRSIRPFTKRR
jgi:hypothetical protein